MKINNIFTIIIGYVFVKKSHIEVLGVFLPKKQIQIIIIGMNKIQKKTTKVGKINIPTYKGTSKIRHTTIIPKPDQKELYQIFQKTNPSTPIINSNTINIKRKKNTQSIRTTKCIVQKNTKQNNNTNKTSTTPYNNQGTRHNTSPSKSHHSKRSTTTKLDSHIVRRTDKTKDKRHKNKISTSSENTNSLLQNNNIKNNDIHSNTEPPHNNCKTISTAKTKRKNITNTTIMKK